jgi:hypothetical protein
MVDPKSLTTNPKQYAPGSFGCHEALHVASVAHDFVDRNLCEHPAIQQNPEWAAQAGYAAQALFDLYQMIGAKHV